MSSILGFYLISDIVKSITITHSQPIDHPVWLETQRKKSFWGQIVLGVVIQTGKVSDTGESLNLGVNRSLMMGFIVFFYFLQIFIRTHTQYFEHIHPHFFHSNFLWSPTVLFPNFRPFLKYISKSLIPNSDPYISMHVGLSNGAWQPTNGTHLVNHKFPSRVDIKSQLFLSQA